MVVAKSDGLQSLTTLYFSMSLRRRLFLALFESVSVSGQLCTYPSPNPTVTLTYELIIICWVKGGVGAQLPQILILIPLFYTNQDGGGDSFVFEYL